MLVQTLLHTAANGWSAPFPALDGPATLVLVFGARRHLEDPAPLLELRRHFAQSVFAGCSSAGEVFGEQILDDALAVAIVRFAATRLHLEHAPIERAADSRDVGRALGRRLDGPDLRGVLVLSDGLNVNGSELVAGMSSMLAAGVVVTGGLAGDGASFERTWVAAGDLPPAPGRVAAIGFHGEQVRIGHGSRGGWDAFGPQRMVTRSRGNVLYELDGRPALALYKEYLGERAAGLPATGLLFPLTIRRTPDDDRSLVRTILAVDEDEQSMTFAGDVPQGWCAQLMMANFDRLIEGAQTAATLARRSDENATSTLAIAVSCVGRRLVLGERAEEEIEATLEGLPAASALVGFYSYGEISPHADGTCDLHNQTMTLTTIQERDG